MATKVAETKFVVNAEGNAQTFLSGVNKKMEEFTRQAAAAKKSSQGWAKSIGDQGKAFGIEGRDSMLTLLRGGGALAITSMVGSTLQGITDAMKNFEEALQMGATRLEAWAQAIADTVPVIGELAKGLDATWRAIGIKGSGSVRDRGEAWMRDQAEQQRRIDRAMSFRERNQSMAGELARMGITGTATDRISGAAGLRVAELRKEMESLELAHVRSGIPQKYLDERRKLLEDTIRAVMKDAGDQIENARAADRAKARSAAREVLAMQEQNRIAALRASGWTLDADLAEAQFMAQQAGSRIADTDPHAQRMRAAIAERLRLQQQAIREADQKATFERGLQLRGQGLQAMAPAMQAIFGWLTRPGAQGLDAQFSGGLAPVVERGGLTGLAAQSRERNTLVNQAKEQTKFLGNIKDGINKIGSSIADLGKKIALFDLN